MHLNNTINGGKHVGSESGVDLSVFVKSNLSIVIKKKQCEPLNLVNKTAALSSCGK